MQEIQRRQSSVAGIKSPGIPKEFEDTKEKVNCFEHKCW